MRTSHSHCFSLTCADASRKRKRSHCRKPVVDLDSRSSLRFFSCLSLSLPPPAFMLSRALAPQARHNSSDGSGGARHMRWHTHTDTRHLVQRVRCTDACAVGTGRSLVPASSQQHHLMHGARLITRSSRAHVGSPSCACTCSFPLLFLLLLPPSLSSPYLLPICPLF